MYIKSTNEDLKTIYDVFNSIEKHIGVEYTNAIQTIIYKYVDECTSVEAIEATKRICHREVEDHQRSIIEKDQAFRRVMYLCDSTLDNIESAKKLQRKSIIKNIEKIKEISHDAYKQTPLSIPY